MKTPIAILKLTEYYSHLNREIRKYEKICENPEMNCDLILAKDAIEGLKETQTLVDKEISILVRLEQQ